jgi:hypothetical protein
MMEAALFRETLVAIYQTTWRHIREDCNINNYGRDHLKSHSPYTFLPHTHNTIFYDFVEAVFHLDQFTN